MLKNILFYNQAIQKLRPNQGFSIMGTDYTSLTFADPAVIKPSEQDIDDEYENIATTWQAQEYQRLRVAEYPSTGEQFDLLYHQGYDAWRAEIEKIKKRYPKPTE